MRPRQRMELVEGQTSSEVFAKMEYSCQSFEYPRTKSLVADASFWVEVLLKSFDGNLTAPSTHDVLSHGRMVG